MIRRTTLALVALMALAALTASPASARPQPPPQDWWGIYGFETPSAGDFERMEGIGVGTYRLFLNWRAVEYQAPEESVLGDPPRRFYYWEETDANFRRATAAGLDIHLSVYGSAGHVANAQETNPARTNKGLKEWKTFVGAAADRYGPGGEFWRTNPGLPESPPIVWQIWNEMNTSARFKPGARPSEYADLLAAAGEEIRARDRTVRIMPGGMFGTPQTPDSMPAWIFMERLLEEQRALPYIDAVGIHPYAPSLRGLKYQIRKMRKVLDQAGMGSTPLELTEIGWSTGVSDRFFLFKGRKGQARLLNKSVKMLLKKRLKWNIDRVIWLSWRDVDDPPANCGFCEKFGLLKINGAEKPAFKKYAKLARPSIGR